MLTKLEMKAIAVILRTNSLTRLEKWSLYCEAVGFKPYPRQQKLINHYWKHRQVCWNLCRGSGKTLLMTHLYVFEQLCGMVRDPFWIASSWSQLNRAQFYWRENSFLIPFPPSKSRDRVTTIEDKVLLFTGATDDNVNGPRGESVKYDEVARFDEDVFWNSIPIASHTPNPYRIFSSTPVSYSVFHKLVEAYPTVTQTYLDCPEMNHEEIFELKKTMPLWLWQMNYMCKFTIPQGVVFPYITEISDIFPSGLKIYQGVDFGIAPGHTLVRVGVLGRKVYILGEFTYKYKTDHDRLKADCHLYPTEVESGGFNESFAPYFTGRNISQMPFTNDNKYERINWLLEREIIINPSICPKTFKDMRKARWETTRTGKPRVETGELHHLAALLHAIGQEESLVDTRTPDTRVRRPILRYT